MPRCFAKSPTIGIEPPLRMKTVSRPRISRKALRGHVDRRMIRIHHDCRARAEHADFGLIPGGVFSRTNFLYAAMIFSGS